MAKDFPEYTFAIADEEDYATEVKDLGLSESGEDVNVAILDESGRKFAMEPEEFDPDVLREFITAFKKGELGLRSPLRCSTGPGQPGCLCCTCARGQEGPWAASAHSPSPSQPPRSLTAVLVWGRTSCDLGTETA